MRSSNGQSYFCKMGRGHFIDNKAVLCCKNTGTFFQKFISEKSNFSMKDFVRHFVDLVCKLCVVVIDVMHSRCGMQLFTEYVDGRRNHVNRI